MKHDLHILGLLLTTGALLPVSLTWGQETSGVASAQTSAASDGATIEEVVVTGSRIQRAGLDLPSPTVVTPTDLLLETTPSNIADALEKLPMFSGSENAATMTGPDGVSTGNFLNLHNLGVQRVLILLDGNRQAPTSSNGTVDTNTLPEMLVERVETVTGGVSAVYGSDAVAGVVNYVLDKKLEGIKVDINGGESTYHDDGSYRVGVAAGTTVGEHGHFEVSVEEHNSKGLQDQEGRPSGAGIYNVVGGGTIASPYTLVRDGLVNYTTAGGLAADGPFAGQRFLNDGSLTPFVHGASTASPVVEIGGDGAYFTPSPAVASLHSDKVFGRFDYEFSTALSGFVQYNFAQARNQYRNSAYPMDFTIYADNAFLNPTAAAELNTAGNSSFTLSRAQNDLLSRQQVSQRTTDNTFTAGLQVSLAGDWKLNSNVTVGSADVTTNLFNNIDAPRLMAALDSVVNPATGAAACRVSLTAYASAYPGCQPLNLFGVGNASQAALQYLSGTTSYDIKSSMDEIGASTSGKLGRTWAGPISWALSAEYRRESLAIDSDANPLTAANFFGLSPNVFYSQGSTAEWVDTTQAPQPQIKESVHEEALEAQVPLAREWPLLKKLDFEGALRLTDYSTSGAVKTWKVGLTWQPFEDLHLRATKSQDILAPNLLQLFSSKSSQVDAFTDPHTGVSGIVNGISQGNESLIPEVSRTVTTGFAYSPSWLPRFTTSIDFYWTRINNAVTQISGNNTAVAEQCEQSGGTSPYCALIVRPHPFSDHSADNFPSELLSEDLNVATVYTKGIDIEASYNFPLSEIAAALPGNLSLRFIDAYQPTLRTTAAPGESPMESAGLAYTPGSPGFSTNQATIFAHYSVGPVFGAVQERYLSSIVLSNSPLQVWAPSQNNIPAYAYTDLTLGFNADAGSASLQTYVSVQNLANKQPPLALPGWATSIPGFVFPSPYGYDIVGRYFTLGVRAKF